MAKLVENFCLQMLPNATDDFLVGLQEEYRIDVPGEKKDDRSYLVRVIYRHLTDPAHEQLPDKGAAMFLKLYTELGEDLKNLGAGPVKTEPKMPDLGAPAAGGGAPTAGGGPPATADATADGGEPTDPASVSNGVVSELSYHKFRQFKINGSIGEPGAKGCISYSSLCYQIKQGEANKYTIKEIYAGVIRAIEAGNPFRDVLELEVDDFDKEAFMKALRGHFMERDPDAIMDDLRKCCQSSKETAHTFACRCVALKKQFVNLKAAEGLVCDMTHLKSTFFRTLSAGIRNSNVRNELRPMFKEGIIADQDLLYEVAMAEKNEKERVRRFEEGEKKVKINKVTCGSDSDDFQEVNSGSASDPLSSSDQGNKNSSAGRQNRKKASQSAQQPQQKSQNSGKKSEGTLSAAQVNKMTVALDKLTTSQAQLVADVNALKQVKNQNNTGNVSGNLPKDGFIQPPYPTNFQGDGMLHVLPPQNPVTFNQNPVVSNLNTSAPVFPRPQQASVFPRPQTRTGRTGRPIYLCQQCIATNSSYCRHCFKCGGDDHKVGECPLN